MKRQRLRKGLILVSFFLFPAIFYYLSPVLIVEAATEGTVNGSMIMFGLLFASALVLGRGYCGWVCPGAGCQEAIVAARPKAVRRGNWIKWVIWVPWIGAIAALAIRAGGYQRVDFFYRTTRGLSIGDVQGLIVYLLVLLVLIVLPAFLIGKRAFCHHLCWMAPFMILGRWLRNRCRWPSLGLTADATRCADCGTCSTHCPMSLPVARMVRSGRMETAECILCGTCVDGCQSHAIGFTWFPVVLPPLGRK